MVIQISNVRPMIVRGSYSILQHGHHVASVIRFRVGPKRSLVAPSGLLAAVAVQAHPASFDPHEDSRGRGGFGGRPLSLPGTGSHAHCSVMMPLTVQQILDIATALRLVCSEIAGEREFEEEMSTTRSEVRLLIDRLLDRAEGIL
jgi:hypothetical protein